MITPAISLTHALSHNSGDDSVAKGKVGVCRHLLGEVRNDQKGGKVNKKKTVEVEKEIKTTQRLTSHGRECHHENQPFCITSFQRKKEWSPG